MKIHEYQAKEIFSQFNIPITKEKLCTTVEEVKHAFQELGKAAIKAQVLVGGRGKAGGIQLACSIEEAEEAANRILGMEIKGLTVDKVLVSEAVDIVSESYVGITTNRNAKSLVIMVSSEGGVEIEEVAKATPEKIAKMVVNPEVGVFDFQARNLAFNLFNDIKLVSKATALIKNLYRCYLETDASLAEINPLVVTADGNLVALDAKINFDDNALYRHPKFEELRDPTEDEKKEIDAKQKGLSYIKLDGEIGCMVNGAGLAMATMDVIKLYGGQPANFLDVGGSSSPQKVINAMNILLSDTNVKVVLINIFGGITRCDDVARGLLTAMNEMDINVPIVVRLTGTNEKEGHEILKDSNLIVASSLSEGAQKAIAVIQPE
jgi:succinyl-CoA synthetase beta subunit